MIQELNIEDIKPNKINPNKMPTGTYSKLKASILKFGLLNPIIVRRLKNCICEREDVGWKPTDLLHCANCKKLLPDIIRYEIIDGEWRWKISKELGAQIIISSIIEATDAEVAQLIMASTIKGQHNMYATSEIIEQLVKTEDNETLKACNLDKDKITRNLKYHGSDKIQRIGPAKGRDEKETNGVKPISAYKKLIFLAEAPSYCKIENGKVVLNGKDAK
jgi:ParB-like chromosome segregation protein Spo0J